MFREAPESVPSDVKRKVLPTVNPCGDTTVTMVYAVDTCEKAVEIGGSALLKKYAIPLFASAIHAWKPKRAGAAENDII